MAMRCLLFFLLIPILFAADKIEIKNFELKILNGVRNGSGYVSIYNGNTYAVNLYKVTVQPEVCNSVELHDHVPRKDENGTEYMEMIEIPEMVIEPGATLFLQPGSKHLMLMGIIPNFCAHKELEFEFYFRSEMGDFTRITKIAVPRNKRCSK